MLDDDEFVDVLEVTLEEALNMVEENKFMTQKRFMRFYIGNCRRKAVIATAFVISRSFSHTM